MLTMNTSPGATVSGSTEALMWSGVRVTRNSKVSSDGLMPLMCTVRCVPRFISPMGFMAVPRRAAPKRTGYILSMVRSAPITRPLMCNCVSLGSPLTFTQMPLSNAPGRPVAV